MLLSSLVLSLATLAGLAAANSPLDDRTVTSMLTDRGGHPLAMQSRPRWHFGSMRPAMYWKYMPMCYPSAALIDGRQHGTQPNKWPDAGSGCGVPGSSFPTYYVVKRCRDDEIRIIYSLYFQHDGFSNVLVAKGHEHDWEKIVVVWNRGGDGLWRRSKLLMSMHGGHVEKKWADVNQTFDFHDIESTGKDRDGVNIYPGWAKHPNFDNRETTWRDSISQGCQREYRSNNWKYMPRAEDMIWASRDSEEGAKMSGFNWGSATGGPWVAEEKVCDISDGGYTKC